ITTEDAATVSRMQQKRLRKGQSLKDALRAVQTVRRFGTGKRIIVTYGSTTMSVREAVAFGSLDVSVLQLVYLEPFPEWEFESLADHDVVVVEQSCAGQLAELLQRRTKVRVRAAVQQYDGRPFDPEALAARLKEVF
ncbi:MAG: 2-oxoacid:acceptor oxidoreductase subunit alpha, partial [Dehalococcoidia bacterium]|nr:2-oxoacid:acceptor oxidoreductase subunit alpha [Dehalococcoidia bacterium]